MIKIKVYTLFTVIILLSCQNERQISNISNKEINSILSNVNENDEYFKANDITFDSIRSYVGIRQNGQSPQDVKMKLFFYDDYLRGYFNLMKQDDKNLQVFGRLKDGMFLMKCVTKINMKEADGYMILKPNDSKCSGIWSNGNINFKKEKIELSLSEVDYSDM